MIHLDFHDPRPMYEQVVEQFEMLIARGALAADESEHRAKGIQRAAQPRRDLFRARKRKFCVR